MCPQQFHDDEPEHSDSYPEADRDGVVVPMRRRTAERNTENVRKTNPDQQVWWYDQGHVHGGSRRFFGHVNRVGGAEGQRLRGELAAVIRDLLVWAAERSHDAAQHSSSQSTEDGEAA